MMNGGSWAKKEGKPRTWHRVQRQEIAGRLGDCKPFNVVGTQGSRQGEGTDKTGTRPGRAPWHRVKELELYLVGQWSPVGCVHLLVKWYARDPSLEYRKNMLDLLSCTLIILFLCTVYNVWNIWVSQDIQNKKYVSPEISVQPQKSTRFWPSGHFHAVSDILRLGSQWSCKSIDHHPIYSVLTATII